MSRRTAAGPAFCAALLALAAGPAGATNVGFLPGDAFFHTTLTKDVADELAGGGAVALRCVQSDHAVGGLCGYAGYWNAELPAGHPLNGRLAELYKRLRKEVRDRRVREIVRDDGAVEYHEENGFRLFLYNHDARHRPIGLRYNETWVTDAAAFYGVPEKATDRVLLDSFILDSAAFALDWRDAAVVPPLRATCPPIPEQSETLRRFNVASPKMKEPITFDGPLLAVVTEDRDLKAYMHPTPETEETIGTTYYAVTADGLRRWRYFRGHGWLADDWPASGEPDKYKTLLNDDFEDDFMEPEDD